MNGEEIVKQNRDYTLFSWSVQSAANPIPVTRAQGVYFWDADGKRYLDFASGLVFLNLGHQHPKVVKAIHEQADKLCCMQPAFATEPRGKLGQMLVHVAPQSLKKAFFTLGGADANENAFKIARAYTKRPKVLARYRSYHGATLGAAALTGDPRRVASEPTAPGVVHMLDPFCYRCPFGHNKATCHRECIKHVEDMVKWEGPESIAAIFMEGVTGTVNGTYAPPDEYWPGVRAICDKYGILLVADEVMSGFGRTGKWFGINHWNILPDMMTMAKGITCGYVPLGAVLVSGAIAEHFENKMLSCGLTYSSHTLACAAGCAAVQAYKDEGVIENAARMGKVLDEILVDLKARHPSVGDARNIGLFSAIELVKDRTTKEPLILPEIAKQARAQGLSLMTPANMVAISPPLIITEPQLKEGMAIIDGLLALADKAL